MHLFALKSWHPSERVKKVRKKCPVDRAGAGRDSKAICAMPIYTFKKGFPYQGSICQLSPKCGCFPGATSEMTKMLETGPPVQFVEPLT